MTERTNETTDAPIGDEEGFEGGKTAPGDATGSRGQLDSASGGYGSQSGNASSGGSGDGEPGAGDTGAGDPGGDSSIDDGTASGATGATKEGPTDWLREG